MTEEELIKEYFRLDNELRAITKQVEKHFGGLFMEALNSKNVDLAYKIMDRCPDFITRVFMLDAIKQYGKENLK
jgi:hypothetical protein